MYHINLSPECTIPISLHTDLTFRKHMLKTMLHTSAYKVRFNKCEGDEQIFILHQLKSFVS